MQQRFSSLNRQCILPVLASVYVAALTVDANQTQCCCCWGGHVVLITCLTALISIDRTAGRKYKAMRVVCRYFANLRRHQKKMKNFLSKCGKWSLYACRLLHGLRPETWAGNLVMFIAFLEQLVLCQSWHRQTFQLTIISWTSLQYIWKSFRKNLFHMLFNLNVSSRTVSDFLLAEIKLYVFFSDRLNFPSCEPF